MKESIMNKDYYIERSSCRTTTKKEKALANLLKAYEYSLVTFSEEFTVKDLQERLEHGVRDINMLSNGRDIVIRPFNYNGVLSFSFEYKPADGKTIAAIHLRPVINYINH